MDKRYALDTRSRYRQEKDEAFRLAVLTAIYAGEKVEVVYLDDNEDV